jgi:hypothetical protein
VACDSVHPANPQPRLTAFLDRYAPAGCYAVYFRLFHIAGTKPASLAVGTGAMETGSVEGAATGLAVAPELLSHLIGDTIPEEVQSPETVGDETRLFHWHHPTLFKASEKPDSSFLVWRSGPTDAAVFVTGGSAEANDRVAFELALLQQKRIESPTAYLPAEFDSAEVALEDPGLDVPVYWLERRFAPGHGLPGLRLYDSDSTTAPKTLDPRVSLLYTDHLDLNRAEGVYLDLWSAGQWRRLQSRGRQLPGSLRCETTVRRLKLHPGVASIFDGFERTGGRCPTRSPETYTARIRIGRVVIVAQTTSICGVCASGGTGRYDSLAGMEAIARGLARRSRPSS